FAELGEAGEQAAARLDGALGVPLTASMWLGDQGVIVHDADIPESDTTVVQGVRCRTALRT
ncbi:MAG: hypothetical protein MUE78_04035, partial [Ilumatobacteraceae bacterium]|nr:hypothetical protein [Ilumatobacteraceae bacterium]